MIRLTDVAKEYPRSGVALAHISFQVKKGEFVFLTGPSGSGKTTILKLLYMDEKPTHGEVWVHGVSANRATRRDVAHLRRRLGVIFQDSLRTRVPAEPLVTLMAAAGFEDLRRRVRALGRGLRVIEGSRR